MTTIMKRSFANTLVLAAAATSALFTVVGLLCVGIWHEPEFPNE